MEEIILTEEELEKIAKENKLDEVEVMKEKEIEEELLGDDTNE
jgi:hypothetical protein